MPVTSHPFYAPPSVHGPLLLPELAPVLGLPEPVHLPELAPALGLPEPVQVGALTPIATPGPDEFPGPAVNPAEFTAAATAAHLYPRSFAATHDQREVSAPARVFKNHMVVQYGMSEGLMSQRRTEGRFAEVCNHWYRDDIFVHCRPIHMGCCWPQILIHLQSGSYSVLPQVCVFDTKLCLCKRKVCSRMVLNEAKCLRSASVFALPC